MFQKQTVRSARAQRGEREADMRRTWLEQFTGEAVRGWRSHITVLAIDVKASRRADKAEICKKKKKPQDYTSLAV